MSNTAVMVPLPPVAPTKLCHLVKRPDFDGYGFNLHSEKVKPGQFIGKVDAKSPAEAAGLKKGDRILEVNGVAIGTETHKQVVQRIKAIENEVRLLLIDVDGNGDATMSREQTITEGSSIKQQTSEETTTTTTIAATKNITLHSNGNHHNSYLNSDLAATSSKQQQDNFLQEQQQKQPHLQSPTLNNNHNNFNNNTLHLPLTAAEMRAKLMSKKKYDPKSESVDLKKKFQIIQTL